MLQATDLAKSFGVRTLWSDLSFTVQRGEMCAVVGPSGSGKSTLLNCLGLLENPDHGRIFVDDADTTRFRRGARRRFRRDTLGYLFQNYALIEDASITANLDAAVGARHAFLRQRRRHYAQALEHVGLTGRGDERVSRLSGGEQQRVALARLLVKRPGLVLADEPTGALDDDNEQMVIDTLREMSQQDCTVLIATHRQRVREQCDSTIDVAAEVPKSATG